MRLFVILLLSLAARGEDSLKDLIESYGREMSEQGSSNTIPVEQAILRARDAGDFATLAEFAANERFGSEILWALGEARKEEAKALAAFGSLPRWGQVEAALSIGAYRSDGARKALAGLLADPELDEPSRKRVEAALLRAGEPNALAAARAALQGKDAGKAADALLLLGDAALEAASRMVASTTPERMAWWSDVEAGPRFPKGPEGVKLLRQWVEEDRKARKAKAVGAEDAVRALCRALRERTPEEPIGMRLRSVAFAKGWTLRYEVQGAEATATVDASGKVAL